MKLRAAKAALIVLGLLVVLIERGDAPEDSRGQGEGGTDSGALLAALRSTIPMPDLDLAEPSEEATGTSFMIARVEPGGQVELHDAPDGRVTKMVGDRTEFGSTRTYWIARVKGDWFGVPTPDRPNGKLGWIENDDSKLEVYETPYSIVADVSSQELELRYGKRTLDRFPVTVGSPSSPTPVGRYSVTDGLAGEGVGPYYGCCVLALTGHQPRLPPDWIGGDRIAIHGTPEPVGGAKSAGCLRASDPDLVSLFARVPLGAPVFIRA